MLKKSNSNVNSVNNGKNSVRNSCFISIAPEEESLNIYVYILEYYLAHR